MASHRSTIRASLIALATALVVPLCVDAGEPSVPLGLVGEWHNWKRRYASPPFPTWDTESMHLSHSAALADLDRLIKDSVHDCCRESRFCFFLNWQHHKRLLHPECSPICDYNFGYYPTRWRPAPDGPPCPIEIPNHPFEEQYPFQAPMGPGELTIEPGELTGEPELDDPVGKAQLTPPLTEPMPALPDLPAAEDQ